MYRSYAPTTEDIDNFRFAASTRLVDLLRGEIDLEAYLDAAFEADDCLVEEPSIVS
jgi:hypothetical protein